MFIPILPILNCAVQLECGRNFEECKERKLAPTLEKTFLQKAEALLRNMSITEVTVSLLQESTTRYKRQLLGCIVFLPNNVGSSGHK